MDEEICGTAHEKFNAFFVKQYFFSYDLLRFWSLGYPRGRGRVGGVIVVLRTFPELVWRSGLSLSLENLP